MPSAFSVAGSPVTSSGTLAVTGAGTNAQYITGAGQLATFPTFDNAITQTGSLVQWGGDLVQSTMINTTTGFDVFFTNSPTLTPPYNLFAVSGTGNFITMGAFDVTNNGSTITILQNGMTFTCTSGGDIAFNSTVRMNNHFALGAGTIDSTVTNSLQAFTGVAPIGPITDGYILYSQDISTNATPHFLSEGGHVISLGEEVGMQSNHDLVLVSNGAEQLRVTTDGRVYGKSLHNNAGAVTGTANQYVASGTYTPTLTNITNITSSSAFSCQWIRVGNVVSVSGKIQMQLSSPGAYQIDLSLPIASSLTAEEQLGGTINSAVSGEGAAILAEISNDRAKILGANNNTTLHDHAFTFTYLIL